MRAVAQRVRSSSVTVGGEVVGQIGAGLLAYVGAMKGDTAEDRDYVANKLVHLRIFEDEDGKMSRSVLDLRGGVLLVPQFTLFGDVRRGRRPSFDDAEAPDRARVLFDELAAAAVAGPITILLDSRKVF
jgi:D-tyrosyl-tRNA(Tyr) deacylase